KDRSTGCSADNWVGDSLMTVTMKQVSPPGAIRARIVWPGERVGHGCGALGSRRHASINNTKKSVTTEIPAPRYPACVHHLQFVVRFRSGQIERKRAVLPRDRAGLILPHIVI